MQGKVEWEKIAPIVAILLAAGIIFGSFHEFATGGAFGFPWFIKMLWFVIGYAVLIIIGLALLYLYGEVVKSK
jgi:protein-S-isoprenylcysteine O-methyltransferase Ste14